MRPAITALKNREALAASRFAVVTLKTGMSFSIARVSALSRTDNATCRSQFLWLAVYPLRARNHIEAAQRRDDTVQVAQVVHSDINHHPRKVGRT